MQVTRDGRPFAPSFLLSIDPKTCIGCGRCFKVCGRDVMSLKGLTDSGRYVDLDEDDDDGDVVKKVMAMNDEGACIGCGACARVCPASCQTHGAGSAQ
jgi:Nif-specific ferredoxin III